MNGRKLRTVALVALVLVTGLACGALGGNGDGPSVTINGPAEGTIVSLGEAVEISSLAEAEAGIAWVELSVNGAVVRRDAPPSGNPASFPIAQRWMPEQAGQATISIVACDVEGSFSQMASVTVQVVAAAGEAAATTPQPSATPTGEPSAPELPTAEPACWVDSEYVADLTIPDGTELGPGVDFVKTWRIRNDGTCDWTSGYQLVFAGGDQMGGRAEVAVPHTRAGTTADLTIYLKSPAEPGVYQGSWRMRSDAGVGFGATLHVRIVVPESAEATGPTPDTPTPTPEDTPTPTPTPSTPTPTATHTPTRTASPTPTQTPPIGVRARGYVQDLGWMLWIANPSSASMYVGTTGQSRRLEAVQIELLDAPSGMHICYETHVQGIGWMNWVCDGETAGTIGESRRIEAIKIWLGYRPPGTIVEYRAYVQDLGWLSWQSDESGTPGIAGSVGQGIRMEALNVRIVNP